MNYRSDIDGLRAIAVVLVIFFHLELQSVPGGFIGVDVFFVISGYLITSILRKAIGDGSFTFRSFFFRRLRRLGPALISTLALTLSVGWFILPPEVYVNAAQSAIAITFAVGNIFFWNETNYFASEALFQPLLHTWSLGVEEQFYFFWPAVLLFCLPRFSAKVFTLAVVVLALVSLALSEQLLNSAPSTAFYLTPFRVFEFAIGAYLALAKWKITNVIATNMIALLGLTCIYYLAVTYNSSTSFPGVNALYPALATGLLILAGPKTIVNRMLTLSAVSYIGRISYSVYLLHWPIIVFYHFLEGRPTSPGEILLLTGLSLLAGSIQYHLIEVPMRQKTGGIFWLPNRTVGIGLGILASLTVAASWHIQQRSGFPEREPIEIQELFAELDAAIQSRRLLARDGRCSGSGSLPLNTYIDNFEDCLPNAEIGMVVILGDSHAKDIYVGLSQAYPSVPLVQMTANSCSLERAGLPNHFCRPYFAFWGEWLSSNADQISAIIYSQNGHSYYANDLLGRNALDYQKLEQLGNGIGEFLLKDVPFVFWGPRPRFDPTIAIAIARSSSRESLPNFYDNRDNRIERQLDAALEMQFQDSSVEYVSALEQLCQPDCSVLTSNDHLFVVDRGHWSPRGAIEAVQLVVENNDTLMELFKN